MAHSYHQQQSNGQPGGNVSKKLIETVYGKRSKFEIYEVPKPFGGKEFIIHKDGDYWKGVFDSLAKAVERAKAEG